MRRTSKALLGAAAALPLAIAATMPMTARAACGPCKPAAQKCNPCKPVKKASAKCNPWAAKNGKAKANLCAAKNPCAAKK